MKVKVKFNPSTVQKVRNKVLSAIDDKVLDFVVDDLKETIRSGTNPKTGKPYKKLAESTIRHREFYAKINSTHPEYAPRRSNLTFTGQLVDSIKGKLKRTSKSVMIEIEPTGTHQGIKLKSGKRSPSIKNKKLAEFLADMGRFVTEISNTQKKRLAMKLREILKKRFR